MNLPNLLTSIRFLLAAVFTALGSLDQVIPAAWSWALAIFVIASITDWLDGYIARKYNLITDFGKLMDPLADKVLVLATLLLFVANGTLPAWVAILILTREFLVTGLRLIAASKGSILAAEGLGKHKTISQIVAILATLLYLAIKGTSQDQPAYLGILATVVPWLFAWATIITVISGVSYFWKNRTILTG